MGGFFDGIVFHQLLQWHHTVCEQGSCTPTSIADLYQKTFVDGLFHAGCWVLTLLGAVLMMRALSRRAEALRGVALAGAVIAGWGAFNVVEGLINHQILRVHHVRPGPNQVAWDVGFLLWGAVMVLAGWIMCRRRRTDSGPTGASMRTNAMIVLLGMSLAVTACSEEPVPVTNSPTPPSRATTPPPPVDPVTRPPVEQADVTQPPPPGGDAVTPATVNGETR